MIMRCNRRLWGGIPHAGYRPLAQRDGAPPRAELGDKPSAPILRHRIGVLPHSRYRWRSRGDDGERREYAAATGRFPVIYRTVSDFASSITLDAPKSLH